LEIGQLIHIGAMLVVVGAMACPALLLTLPRQLTE